MTGATLLAAWENFGKPEQILAIVGGAAVGAVGAGLLAQLLCRWMTTRKLPPGPTMVVRAIGGIVLGLLTAMWVWQGGGWGPFGPGGPGGHDNAGPGPAKPEANKPPEASPNKNSTDTQPQPPPEKETPTPPESVLRVEVLTDDALRKLPGGDEAVQDKREYRVESDDPKSLHTLDEMREVVRKRLSDKPPLLRLDIVLRPGASPDRTAGRVTQLRNMVAELAPNLTVEYPPR